MPLGAYLRTWGFRSHSGVRDTAPWRIRGLLARRSITEGGRYLLAGRGIRIVKRDGGGQPLVVGDRARIADGVSLIFEGPDGRIELGEDVFLNERCEIRSRERVRIGSHCRIAFGVVVMDTNHHDLAGSRTTAPTVLGDSVWVGAHAMILRGVSVGEGAVVAAGAIVTRDVPARALVAGNPARVLREGVEWS